MNDLAVADNRIAPMSEEAIAQVREIESQAMTMPQARIDTDHLFHAGMYSRTVRIPAGVILTGALIKIATLLIVDGNALMFTGQDVVALRGHKVLAGDAGRKQAFYAYTDTHLTMVFPTEATTVEDAELEFTDEAHLLMTRRSRMEV